MTFRKVLKWPDKFLKDKSLPASLEDEIVIKDLLDTFRVIGGYGLAAPQIGFHKRIIIINERALTKNKESSEEKILINPKIISFKEISSFKEACFSIDEAVLDVKRYKEIIVSYTSIEGKKEEFKAEGYHSACIQHEIDHLDGILMLDKISPLRRTMFLKKRKKQNLKNKRLKSSLEAKDEPRPGFRKKK